MDALFISIMIIIFLGVGYLIFLMSQKHKYFWIPSLGLFDVGVILLTIPRLIQDSTGWDNLGYVIIGIFLVLVSIILALIISIFRYFKYAKLSK